VNLPENQPQMIMRQYWLGKTKLSDQPEILSKSHYGIFFFKLWHLTEFSIDWLTDWCLQISVTQQWLGLRAWFFCCLTSFQPERCLFAISLCMQHMLITKSVSFVADTWWLLFITEIVRNFHSGYFACSNSFQRVVDSYCCIVGWTQLAMKRNGYFTQGSDISDGVSWNFYWFMPTFTGESLKYTEKQRIYAWFLIYITGAYEILLSVGSLDFTFQTIIDILGVAIP